MKKHHVMLCCCAAMIMGACAPQSGGIEETPPPAASEGMEAPPPAPMEPAAEAPPPAPEPAAPAAAPPAPPKPEPPTVGAVVTHKVKDYDAWKQAFDAHESARAQAGIVGHGLSVDADKKKTVVVYLGSQDLGALQAFLESKDLKKVMKEAGVRGKPKITYMKHTESKPAEGQAAITAMATLKVEDYAAWKTNFDAQADKRAEASVIGTSVSQDPDDPNLVYVYVEATDAEKLRAFSKSKELKAAFKAGGVKGKPKMTFMEPREMKFYPPEASKPAEPAAAAEAPPAPAESPAPTPAAPAGP